MNISEQITDIEARLKAKKIAVQDVCDAASVNRATYQRWKSGETMPNWKTWQRFLDIVEPYMGDEEGEAA